MTQILQQVLSLLTTSPGNLAYHSIVAFLIVIVLQNALVPWRAHGLPQGRRMAAGAFFLLIGQLVLFASALIAGQNLGIPDVLFPILDRAITAMSLAIIVWLWAFPDTLRLADAATWLIGLLVLSLSVFTYVWWSNQEIGAFFNGTLPDVIWGSFSLVVIFLGGLALLTRRPAGWSVGAVMLLILAAGHLAHLLSPLQNSDYPGAVRFAQLVAYPLLLFLSQRYILPSPAASTSQPVTLIPDRRRYNVGPQVFEAFLSLATGSEPGQICQAIARTISEALLADICLLVAPPDDDNNMAIECGYDLIREEYQQGGYLSKEQVPMLATALQRGRALRLPANSSSEDLLGLSEALNISRSGSLLAVPIFSPDDDIIAGVVLLSPYSNRSWTPEDQNYLLGVSKSIGKVILRIHDKTPAQQAIDLEQHPEYQRLLKELQFHQQQSAQEQERAETLAEVIANQEAFQEIIAELQAENLQLKDELEEIHTVTETNPQETKEVQGELRLALEEVAYLRNQLAEADQKITQLEKAAPGERPLDKPAELVESDEVIASLAQELRQPLSSMIGYTDLLLSESAGILGALQRKFVERIRVSSERLGALVDDLIQVSSLDSGTVKLAPEMVDLHAVIQEIIEQTESQVQAKELDFKHKVPEELPSIHADRDALQQALTHLLQNAVDATPEEGEISLQIQVEKSEDKQDYVLFQVRDQGGGIPPEDLPRVFSRLYRADNALIQGVGDTGVGLSIVKQLVEAHGGRIWVDTDLGHGSIFSLLLPVNQPSVSTSGDNNGRGTMAA